MLPSLLKSDFSITSCLSYSFTLLPPSFYQIKLVNMWVKGWFEHSVLFLKSGSVMSYSLSALQFLSRFVQLTSSSLHYLSWTRGSFKLHELKHWENYVTVLFSNSAVSEHFIKMWKVVTRHFSPEFLSAANVPHVWRGEYCVHGICC